MGLSSGQVALMAQAQAVMDQELVAAWEGEQCGAARPFNANFGDGLVDAHGQSPAPVYFGISSAAHLDATKGQVSTHVTSRCG